LFVTKADDVVKARLAAAEASRGAGEEQARIDQLEGAMTYLIEAIPRLLASLERRDYPNAELLRFSVPGPTRLLGRRQQRSIEMAAWVLDEDKWSEGHSSVHLLSDGRLAYGGWGSQSSFGSGPIEVSEIPIKYSEQGAIEILGRAAKGVKRLIG
jgi:hypothetical protein